MDRPYRKALTHDEALLELEGGKGSQFDPELVDAFIAAMNSERLTALSAG